MAISDFSELKAAIAEWLWKTGETSTTAAIPDMIAMAEGHFNRRLTVRKMDAVEASLTITSGVATLPTGFRSLKSLRLTDSPYTKVSYKPIDWIESQDPANTRPPEFYDRVGDELIMWPPTSATARLRYRKAFTVLSDAAPTNWLLTAHPDLYLMASLSYGTAFGVSDDRIPIFKALAQQALDEINIEDRNLNEDGVQMQTSVTTIV
ncbi:MAG: hypothetical protein AAGK02_04685 [Pseudomonadota bacterium]